ncbi:hypothetical protein CA85_41920 [Allorhodopirellula solitaria]|uniref:Uncharacterized protein n=1 Tax=Allorhodopirellula solitaria TaxID=2527987 RepID=A0A5C5X198_9BACT|nr:hypothetical protein CA85_41920 [Allorhodopirellula solitaria]
MSRFDSLAPALAAAAPEREVWWVGEEAMAWRESFIELLRSARSPKAHASTPEDCPQSWRIHLHRRDTLSLPRQPIHGRENGGRSPALVIWAVPSEGIAELVDRIGEARRCRPGYEHLTAGLVSPVERTVLFEVGVRAHLQGPRHWRLHARLLGG